MTALRRHAEQTRARCRDPDSFSSTLAGALSLWRAIRHNVRRSLRRLHVVAGADIEFWGHAQATLSRAFILW